MSINIDTGQMYTTAILFHQVTVFLITKLGLVAFLLIIFASLCKFAFLYPLVISQNALGVLY